MTKRFGQGPLGPVGRRRWRQLSSVVATGCLAGVAAAGPAGATTSHTAATLTSSNSPACSLPLTHDSYQGFHVGVPPGWDLSTLDGTVSVAKNTSGTEASLIYPAALTSGLTPSSFFASYMRYQQKLVAKSGASLTFKMQPDVGGLPRASVRVQSKRLNVVGEASVAVLPLHTQFSSKEAVFSVYWAPPARLAADGAMLAAIGQCYGPEPASLFQVFRDQSFTYILPPGWTTFDEGQDNIDLRGYANRADVSYLFFGLPAQYNTPSLALSHIFEVDKVTVTSVLSTISAPPQQTSSGAVQGVEYVEFLGRSAGLTIHGLVYILTDSGSSGTFGVMRLGAATTDLWNSVNGGLIEMMGSIQHSFVQDLQDIQRLNQQWQAESAQEANFDDIINGQQLVQDPSTGAYYEAPYASYEPNGPNGPGYYLPDGQLLNPVSH